MIQGWEGGTTERGPVPGAVTPGRRHVGGAERWEAASQGTCLGVLGVGPLCAAPWQSFCLASVCLSLHLYILTCLT